MEYDHFHEVHVLVWERKLGCWFCATEGPGTKPLYFDFLMCGESFMFPVFFIPSTEFLGMVLFEGA